MAAGWLLGSCPRCLGRTAGASAGHRRTTAQRHPSQLPVGRGRCGCCRHRRCCWSRVLVALRCRWRPAPLLMLRLLVAAAAPGAPSRSVHLLRASAPPSCQRTGTPLSGARQAAAAARLGPPCCKTPGTDNHHQSGIMMSAPTECPLPLPHPAACSSLDTHTGAEQGGASLVKHQGAGRGEPLHACNATAPAPQLARRPPPLPLQHSTAIRLGPPGRQHVQQAEGVVGICAQPRPGRLQPAAAAAPHAVAC